MTNAVQFTLADISRRLNARHVGWALVGGFAVSVRAEPRFTRDVDVVVAVSDDAEGENLVRSLLVDEGFTLVMTVDHEPTGRLATVRLLPPATEAAAPVYVDLLLASSGIEPEVVAAAQAIETLPGLRLPVARAGHLVVLKLLARESKRPQDDMDLLALRPMLTEADAALARSGAALVVERGFHRDRDLVVDVEAYLARLA